MQVRWIICLVCFFFATLMGWEGWNELQYGESSKFGGASAFFLVGTLVGFISMIWLDDLTDRTKSLIYATFTAYLAVTITYMCYTAEYGAIWWRYGGPIVVWALVVVQLLHAIMPGHKRVRVG